MPQATKELTLTILDAVGSTDLYEVLKFLTKRGFQFNTGKITYPNRDLTPLEWDCLDFLWDEWDY